MTIEEEAQDILARVVDCDEPPLGFTADDIVARGRRQVYARRARRTAGGAISVIAMTAAVLPLAAFDSRGTGASVERRPDLAKLAETDPHCYEQVMASLKPDDEKLNQPVTKLDIQLCPVIRRIHGVLDTQAGSFNTDDTDALPPLHSDLISYYGGGTWPDEYYVNQVYWTPEGRFSDGFSSSQTARQPVTIEVAVQAPGTAPQYREVRWDHGQTLPSENTAMEPGPWGPTAVVTLPDETTVSVHSQQGSTGESIEAIRTLKSGIQVFLLIYDNRSAGGTAGFPFAEQQAVSAMSIPITEDIHLPKPSRS